MNTAPSQQDLIMFRAAQAIANLVHRQVAQTPGLKIQDRRRNGINPFEVQTASGLYLVVTSYYPDYILTPWGAWEMGPVFGGTIGQLRKMAADLMLQLSIGGSHPEIAAKMMAASGTAYSVMAVGNTRLPRPSVRPRSQHLDYRSAKEMWRLLGRATARR